MTATIPLDTLGLGERLLLERCEATIAAGKQTFLEVGNALADIREHRLYRATHGSFEAYLRERWQISKTQANRLIDASHLAEELTPIGVIVENENQARGFGAIREDLREEAIEYAKARAEAGHPVTMHEVISAAKEIARTEPQEPEVPTPRLQAHNENAANNAVDEVLAEETPAPVPELTAIDYTDFYPEDEAQRARRKAQTDARPDTSNLLRKLEPLPPIAWELPALRSAWELPALRSAWELPALRSKEEPEAHAVSARSRLNARLNALHDLLTPQLEYTEAALEHSKRHVAAQKRVLAYAALECFRFLDTTPTTVAALASLDYEAPGGLATYEARRRALAHFLTCKPERLLAAIAESVVRTAEAIDADFGYHGELARWLETGHWEPEAEVAEPQPLSLEQALDESITCAECGGEIAMDAIGCPYETLPDGSHKLDSGVVCLEVEGREHFLCELCVLAGHELCPHCGEVDCEDTCTAALVAHADDAAESEWYMGGQMWRVGQQVEHRFHAWGDWKPGVIMEIAANGMITVRREVTAGWASSRDHWTPETLRQRDVCRPAESVVLAGASVAGTATV